MTAKIKVKRVKNFTTLQNDMIQDSRLSLKTKGLMVVMLSRPDDWEFSVAGLAVFCGCGRDAIRASLKELELAGYLTRQQLHDENGAFGGNLYIIREVSTIPDKEAPPLPGNQSTVTPPTRKPSAGDPLTENPTELNTDLTKEPPKAPQRGRHSRGDGFVPKWKPERFYAFWEFYRKNARGEDRKAAVREWDKLKPDDETIAKIGRALNWQIKTADWQNGIGIPYACRYLKNRRWEDTPPPVRQGKPARSEQGGGDSDERTLI